MLSYAAPNSNILAATFPSHNITFINIAVFHYISRKRRRLLSGNGRQILQPHDFYASNAAERSSNSSTSSWNKRMEQERMEKSLQAKREFFQADLRLRQTAARYACLLRRSFVHFPQRATDYSTAFERCAAAAAAITVAASLPLSFCILTKPPKSRPAACPATTLRPLGPAREWNLRKNAFGHRQPPCSVPLYCAMLGMSVVGHVLQRTYGDSWRGGAISFLLAKNG